MKNIVKKYDAFRNIYGTYKIIKSWTKYFFKNDYPYKNSINAVGNRSDEQFKDFFTKVEIERAKRKPQTHNIWKNNVGLNHVSLEKSQKDGAEWLKFLIKNGLKKTDKVLDYGCGSLRLGKTLMEFLEPGKYVGVDISDHFYNLGKKHYVNSKIINEKKPRFFIINSNDYEKFMTNKKFDYIYSSWVLMHIPPYELNNYFQNIFPLMHNKTKFYFDFMHSIIT